MKAYGNLINRIEEHSLSPEPVVNMGATIYMWSDRHAATVVAVTRFKNGKVKSVTLREDVVAEWKNDYGVSFLPSHNGRLWTATKRKNGTWTTGTAGVTLGNRAAYFDRGF